MSRAAAVAAPQLVHPTARFERRGLVLLAQGAVFLLAMAVSLAVLLHFHDRFWWAPGEGAQALAAERLLAGRGQELPAAAVHWINALAFKVFGVDLVSLRYPLLALTLVQAALGFWLLAGRGVLIAFSGALGFALLTFVQFLAPVAPWYALFTCLLIVAVLAESQGERRGSLEAVGFLLAALFLFQPLGGIFAGMGVLTFLLLLEQRHPGRERAILARGLVVLMFGGLALYLRAELDVPSAALFGVAPLLLLGTAFVVTRLGSAAVLRLLLRLALGIILALTPVLTYHLAGTSLAAWGGDILAAIATPPLAGLAEGPGVGELAVLALRQVFGGGQGAALLNGLFWLALLLLPAGLGLLQLPSLWRGEPAGRAAVPVLACFFALVSASLQAPPVLFFSAALSLAAILFLAGAAGRRRGYLLAVCGLALSLVGLTYQAGQPMSRGWEATIAGKTKTVVAPLGLPRASLTVAAEEAALYGLLLDLIERHSDKTDRILVLPANAELCFLSGRADALGKLDLAPFLADAEALQAVQRKLSEEPPRLLIHRPEDPRTTLPLRRLVTSLLERYRFVETAGGFEIYQLIP